MYAPGGWSPAGRPKGGRIVGNYCQQLDWDTECVIGCRDCGRMLAQFRLRYSCSQHDRWRVCQSVVLCWRATLHLPDRSLKHDRSCALQSEYCYRHCGATSAVVQEKLRRQAAEALRRRACGCCCASCTALRCRRCPAAGGACSAQRCTCAVRWHPQGASTLRLTTLPWPLCVTRLRLTGKDVAL